MISSLIPSNSSALSKFCSLFLKGSPCKLISKRFIKVVIIMGFESNVRVCGYSSLNQPTLSALGSVTSRSTHQLSCWLLLIIADPVSLQWKCRKHSGRRKGGRDNLLCCYCQGSNPSSSFSSCVILGK